MTTHKVMKFRVADEAQSVALQEVLFKLGYSWVCINEVYQTTAKFLYTDQYGNIMYDDADEDFFASDPATEHNTKDFIALHTKPKKSKWKSVAVDGFPPEIELSYLVYCEHNECQYMLYLDGNSVWHVFGTGEVFNQYNVTHWRKRPKNPEGV